MNKPGYFRLGLVFVSGCTPPHESSRETGETPLIVNDAVQSRLGSALKSLVDEGRVAGGIFPFDREVHRRFREAVYGEWRTSESSTTASK